MIYIIHNFSRTKAEFCSFCSFSYHIKLWIESIDRSICMNPSTVITLWNTQCLFSPCAAFVALRLQCWPFGPWTRSSWSVGVGELKWPPHQRLSALNQGFWHVAKVKSGITAIFIHPHSMLVAHKWWHKCLRDGFVAGGVMVLHYSMTNPADNRSGGGSECYVWILFTGTLNIWSKEVSAREWG